MRVVVAAPVDASGFDPEPSRALARAAEALGHEVLHVDAPLRAGESARAAFEREFDALQRADLLLADASQASASVGWKVAWTLSKGRLAIVATRRGVALAPALAGNPSPWQRRVEFADARELEARVKALLS